MTWAGGVLHQDAGAGNASAYRSDVTAGLMKQGTSDYTVDFTAKVLSDTSAGDWYTNTILIWGDDVRSYDVVLYKNGTGGGLRSGSGTTVGNLSDVVTGVNWSTAHKFDIAYTGTTDQFSIYVDGAIKTTVSATSLVQGGLEPFWQNRVVFGDYLSGPDADGVAQTDWSSVSLLNTAAVPEPASLAACGLAGVMTLRRKRR